MNIWSHVSARSLTRGLCDDSAAPAAIITALRRIRLRELGFGGLPSLSLAAAALLMIGGCATSNDGATTDAGSGGTSTSTGGHVGAGGAASGTGGAVGSGGDAWKWRGAG